MNILHSLAMMLAGAAVRDYYDQQKQARRASPEASKPICDGCNRAAARYRCPAHKRVMCGRCRCPECKAIKSRLAAGKPRTPANYTPPAAIPVARLAPPLDLPHDPTVCRCPWCCKFDGPAANDQQAGMA